MLVRAQRLFGFVVVPALSLLTPLLVIPLVARHGGADAVVAVAVGQSVGFVGSLVVSLAWPMIGPARVARCPDESRGSLFLESIDSRGLVFLAAGPVAAGFAAILTDGFAGTAMLSAVALSANGLSAAWYYAGVGRPRGLLLFEALVRVVSAGAAAAMLAFDAPVVTYPAALCVGALVSYALNLRHIVGRVRWPRVNRGVVSSVRSQLRITAARLVNGAYQAAAVSIVAALAPAAVLAFSAYDRTQKSSMLATQAATDAVISWVAAPTPGLRRRQVRMLLADVLFAGLVGVTFFAALPLVLHYMYAGLIAPDPLDRALAATGLAVAIFAKGVLTHALVPSGLERVAATSLSITSIGGLGATAVGAATLGVPGALGAVVLTEGTFVVIGLIIWLGRPETNPPATPTVAEMVA